MNKKNYLWIAIGLVIVIAVIYLLVSATKTPSSPAKDSGAAKSANPALNVPKADALNPTGGEEVKQEKVSKEVLLEVDGASFTPKTIEVEAGSRGFLTFSAKDDKQHLLASDDPKLPLLVTFSKKEGIKSTSFETPGVGSYTFYIDDKANTGTLIVK